MNIIDIIDRLRLHDDERLYAEADILMSEAADEIERLRLAIIETLDENGHLADGDNCTLIKLKRAVPTVQIKVGGALPDQET